MLIRFKKLDGGVVLTCIPLRGTPAVQRTGYGGFFALHDLMHYVVETTLQLDSAFFGLMSRGWTFETFSDRSDPRSRQLPAQALLAEHLVAILSRRILDEAWRDPDLFDLWAAEVNAELAQVLPEAVPIPRPTLREIGDRFTSLARQWAEVPIGEHLELHFPPSAASG